MNPVRVVTGRTQVQAVDLASSETQVRVRTCAIRARHGASISRARAHRQALRPELIVDAQVGTLTYHPASPATRLIVVAMITTPRGNDSQACRRAVRRICLVWMFVSETWNVMPIVKDR